jgi:hypothetical protein
MAKIPGNIFGGVIAQPGPREQVDTSRAPNAEPNAYGAGVGRALETAGTIGMTIAGDQMRAEQQVQQEALRVQQQALRKSEEIRERTIAVTAREGVKNDLAALHADIDDRLAKNSMQPGEAIDAFKKESGKIIEARVKGLPPDLAGLINAESVGHSDSVRLNVAKSAEGRSRQLLTADIQRAGEELERSALTNRAGAVQGFAQVLGVMGPQAGMPADKMAGELQKFREKTAFNSATALVRSARDDQAGLDGVMAAIRSPEFADLSPERVGQLEQQVLSRKALLESKEQTRIQRAEAGAARRERQAESAMKSVQMMIDNGGAPDEATAAQAAARVAGTAFAPVLTEILRSAGQNAGFSQLPPRKQEAAIIEMRTKLNQQGTNPAAEKRLQNFERIADQSKKQLAEDPLAYAVNRRLIDIQPLQFKNLDELIPQLGQRAEAARTLTAHTGVQAPMLLASEAETVGTLLDALPLPLRQAAVKRMAQQVEPGMLRATGSQISRKDPALGRAMFAASALPPVAYELILRGQDAKRAGRIKPDDALAKDDNQRIARQMNEINWGTPAARDDAAQTASDILDGMRDRGDANVREAIKLATGGIGEWGGSKVPLPPGMEERQFERRLDGMAKDPAKLASAIGVQIGVEQVTIGGAPMPVDQLARQLGRVKLISAGAGRYALEAGGNVVLGPNGKPVRLDLRK